MKLQDKDINVRGEHNRNKEKLQKALVLKLRGLSAPQVEEQTGLSAQYIRMQWRRHKSDAKIPKVKKVPHGKCIHCEILLKFGEKNICTYCKERV